MKYQPIDYNPFGSASHSESRKDHTTVKVLKGGRLRENGLDRFSIINTRPVFKDQHNQVIINFGNSMKEDGELIIRSKTENNIKKKDFIEIDDFLLSPKGNI